MYAATRFGLDELTRLLFIDETAFEDLSDDQRFRVLQVHAAFAVSRKLDKVVEQLDSLHSEFGYLA